MVPTTIPYEGVVIAAVVFVMSVLFFVIYLLATGQWSEVKRVSPFLGIAGFFVAAGGFLRLYPYEWANALSSAFIAIGYLLALFFVAKEFALLPHDQRELETGVENILFDVKIIQEEARLEARAGPEEVKRLKENVKNSKLYLDAHKHAKQLGDEAAARKFLSQYVDAENERRKYVRTLSGIYPDGTGAAE